MNLGGKAFISPLVAILNCEMFMNVLEYIKDAGGFFFLPIVFFCLLTEECDGYLSTIATKYLVQVFFFNRFLYDLRVLEFRV